jgi:hypothetical protein
MAYTQAPKSDEVSRTEHQCRNCGSWINKAGYMDDQHRTRKAVFCDHCNSAAKRKEADKEQKKIENERGEK